MRILGRGYLLVAAVSMLAGAISVYGQQSPPPESAECAMRVERINTLTGEVKDLQSRVVEISRQRDEAARRVFAEKQRHRDAVQSMLAIVNQKGKSEKQRLSEVGTALLTEEEP